MAKLCLFYGQGSRIYSFPNGHPLNKSRVESFWRLLKTEGLVGDPGIVIKEPEEAHYEDLLYFHTREYLSFVRRASAHGSGYLDDGDTPAFKGIFEAAAKVAGATLRGLEMVMRGKIRMAFNPVGGLHHARRDRAGGFCVFNDPGIAIEKARRIYGVKRVLYIDIDAHHGDGVCYDFYGDPFVYTADIHEDGRFLYPGTGFADERGAEGAEGTKLNIPLSPGSGDREFRESFRLIDKHADKARPDLIILQCGADGLEGDPITHLRYSSHVHEFVTSKVLEYANEYSGGRILSLGGGGYDPENVARAWVTVVETLLNHAKI